MRPLLVAPLLCLLAGSVPLSGQSESAPDAGVRASLSGRLGVQSLGGAALVTGSARLWLHFGESWRLGFGGVRGLNRTEGGDLESSGLEARFGMASVTVGRTLPPELPIQLEGTLTFGSGAVSLENALLGTTLDTETVWTLEPGLAWRFRTFGPLRLDVDAGYRWILGSGGLSRLEGDDLNTFVLGVTLAWDRQ